MNSKVIPYSVYRKLGNTPEKASTTLTALSVDSHLGIPTGFTHLAHLEALLEDAGLHLTTLAIGEVPQPIECIVDVLNATAFQSTTMEMIKFTGVDKKISLSQYFLAICKHCSCKVGPLTS